MGNWDQESNLSHPACCYQMLTKTKKQESNKPASFAILEVQGTL